jgi:hypothetical protein
LPGGLDVERRFLSQKWRWPVTSAPFDTLKLSRLLRERAHFDQEQSEGLAETLAKAFQEEISQPRPILRLLEYFPANGKMAEV